LHHIEKISVKVKSEISTPEKLTSIIKSARDIMRKDKGLNGDLDRLPQLTWIMFLKFLDDMEKIRETETTVANKKYEPLINSPYRWRDWAKYEDGITGDELISFVNNDEVTRPDGSRGLGLLSYLRSIEGKNGIDRRNIISTIFREIDNRMRNGYLLRDVINKVNRINFSSSDEIHTLSHLYETILKELRDAAGDSGEFYTPRPVVKFMVKMIDPKIGEKILDPAAGTGGFLLESFIHLEKQCKTTKDFETLQFHSLEGIEAKSLPYMLCQMNLLLHGIETPKIDPLNALRFPLHEIGEKDRVDIIMTNPPFGGEEESGILSNFPKDKQTSETALLFLQLIMKKLKRKTGEVRSSRCAIVLPKGTPLSGTGASQRIRKELLENFNLHTIIKLPKGVFSPYTPIATNLIFFDLSGNTKEIWYYEIFQREGKGYSKSHPMLFEEFNDCILWWEGRFENQNAWKVPIKKIEDDNFDLDQMNPNSNNFSKKESPKKMVGNMLKEIKEIESNLFELNNLLNGKN